MTRLWIGAAFGLLMLPVAAALVIVLAQPCPPGKPDGQVRNYEMRGCRR